METRQQRIQQNKSDGERKLKTRVTCPPRDSSCLSITFDKPQTKGANVEFLNSFYLLVKVFPQSIWKKMD